LSACCADRHPTPRSRRILPLSDGLENKQEIRVPLTPTRNGHQNPPRFCFTTLHGRLWGHLTPSPRHRHRRQEVLRRRLPHVLAAIQVELARLFAAEAKGQKAVLAQQQMVDGTDHRTAGRKVRGALRREALIQDKTIGLLEIETGLCQFVLGKRLGQSHFVAWVGATCAT